MAKLLIFHPQAGETVLAEFLVAQGICDDSVTGLVGDILDASGKCVARSEGCAQPPGWALAFERIHPGRGYSLDVRDAMTGDRLACVGPFDAVRDRFDIPGMIYPGSMVPVGVTFRAYGKTSPSPVGVAVHGQVTSPTGGALGWVDQSQGQPQTQTWMVPLSAPEDLTASTSVRVENINDSTKANVANNLTVRKV